jgi:SAM-dependent methyltransferase
MSEKAEHYRLKRMVDLLAGADSVLDIGASDMPNTYINCKRLVAIDLQEGKYTPNYHEAYVGDAMKMPHPFKEGEFDAIIAGELLEHLPDPLGFLKACSATIKPGGKIVLSTPNPNSIWERILTLNLSRKYFYTKNHVCLYPQRWLIRMMEIAGFTDVKIISGGITIPFINANIPFPRPWAHYTIAYGVKK